MPVRCGILYVRPPEGFEPATNSLLTSANAEKLTKSTTIPRHLNYRTPRSRSSITAATASKSSSQRSA